MLSPATAKKLRRRLDGRDPADAVRELIAECDAAIARARASHARMKALPKPPPPGKTKAERKEEHRRETGKLRSDVWQRAGGTARWDPEAYEGAGEWICEGSAKDEVYGFEITSAAWDLHHLEGGGARRSQQSTDNCLALAWDTHRLIHRGDMRTLLDVKGACIRLGLRDGLRATEKRIDHMEGVRRG
jgi:hypothetical protein